MTLMTSSSSTPAMAGMAPGGEAATATPNATSAPGLSWARLALGFLGVLLLVALACAPWWAERSSLRLLTEFLCVLSLAQLWNLLAGYGGMASMGQQAYIGLGAYALVVLGLQGGVPAFWVVPLAAVLGAVVAIPTARVVFRLRGAYLSIGTWVVAEVFRLFISNLPQVSGGSGVSIAPMLRGIDAETRDALSLWLALGMGAGTLMAMYALMRSRWGLALTAVRDSEPASESLGVDVPHIKWLVYVAGSAGAAMVGALLFITKLRVSPDAAFSMEWTTLMFFSVVIGGIGTLEGPLLGALVYFALRELLSDVGSAYLIALGGLTVVVMLWAPQGLWGLIAQRWDVHLFPVRRRVRASGRAPAIK